MAPNPIHLYELVTSMAPNPIHLYGLVKSLAPNPIHLYGLVTSMAPNPINSYGFVVRGTFFSPAAPARRRSRQRGTAGGSSRKRHADPMLIGALLAPYWRPIGALLMPMGWVPEGIMAGFFGVRF